MPDFPTVFDPETGEVLATNEEEREALIQLCALQLAAEHASHAAAKRARLILADVLEVGDARPILDAPGYALMVEPPASPARQVVPAKLEEHHEALRPLGLSIERRTVEEKVQPTVGQLTSKEARQKLARVGLTPETFLYAPEPGPSKIVLVPPDESPNGGVR